MSCAVWAPDTDEELAARWRAGDARAGNELVGRYLPAIYKYFCNKTQHRADVADLVNQTFLACAESVGRFEGRSEFRGYLYGIARNVLHTYLRRRAKRMRELEDFAEICVHDLFPRSVSSVVGHHRASRLLVEGLRRVPLADQTLLELRYFSELDATEIAHAMGTAPATLRGRLARARTRLREAIETYVSETPLANRETASLGDDTIATWAREVRDQLRRVDAAAASPPAAPGE